MTTSKLIILRVYNMFIGRFSFGKNILRRFLEKKLIKPGQKNTYSPCTKFFNKSDFYEQK